MVPSPIRRPSLVAVPSTYQAAIPRCGILLSLAHGSLSLRSHSSHRAVIRAPDAVRSNVRTTLIWCAPPLSGAYYSTCLRKCAHKRHAANACLQLPRRAGQSVIHTDPPNNTHQPRTRMHVARANAYEQW